MKNIIWIVALFCTILVSSTGCNINDKSVTFTDQNSKQIDESKVFVNQLPKLITFINLEDKQQSESAMSNILKIHEECTLMGIPLKVVLISVNASNSPAQLKAFLKNNKLEKTSIVALKAKNQSITETYIKNKFSVFVRKDHSSGTFIYSTNFFLIDKNGKIAGEYSGVQSVPYDEIISHIRKINRENN